MIPETISKEAGRDFIRKVDGQTYRVLAVFGRGRNRQVKLDRRPPGWLFPYVGIQRFRRQFTRKAAS